MCGSVTVEGVMRGIAVPENHADRKACIGGADRGGECERTHTHTNMHMLSAHTGAVPLVPHLLQVLILAASKRF